MFYSSKTHRSAEAMRITLWTRQLYEEFEDINYDYKLYLTKPVIRVEDLSSRWGSWNATTRTICIARQLIENIGWQATIEVLKHEMAHMIVCEKMGLLDHNHGAEFKEACRTLGISSWAQASEADLMTSTPGQEAKLSSDDEKLLRRVEKLLALCGSSNEHEALIAMKKVRELYSKYNIDRLRSPSEISDFGYKIINHQKKRIPQHQSVIAGILMEHFFVEVVFSDEYDPESHQTYKTMEILGQKHNVNMAEYVYHFLLRSIETLWLSFKKQGKKGVVAKRSYYLGVLEGFSQKLRKEATMRTEKGVSWQLDDSSSEVKSLVALCDKELKSYLAYRFPRLCKRRSGASKRDMDSYAAGKKEGQDLVLRKGVTSGHSGEILRLK